jgi:hypothetical protein
MDKTDEEFIVKVLRLFEVAFFRNLALETLLEFHKIPHWKTHADQMTIDPRVQPETRAAFQRIYASFERDQPQTNRQNALQEFLKLLPTTGKIQ